MHTWKSILLLALATIIFAIVPTLALDAICEQVICTEATAFYTSVFFGLCAVVTFLVLLVQTVRTLASLRHAGMRPLDYVLATLALLFVGAFLYAWYFVAHL